MEKELRNFAATELRAADADGATTIEGYAVLWGSLSEEMGGGMFEQFQRGAFAESLKRDDIRVVWQHDNRHVFGRVKAGTAKVWEDDKGLAFRATAPAAQWARDAVESIRRGDVTQNSFSFRIEDRNKDQDFVTRDGKTIRTVKRASLFEVGPQTQPAYADTTVAVRSLEEARKAGVVEGEAPPEPPKAPEPDVPNYALEQERILLAEVEQDGGL